MQKKRGGKREGKISVAVPANGGTLEKESQMGSDLSVCIGNRAIFGGERQQLPYM